jgi:hypothetical protein
MRPSFFPCPWCDESVLPGDLRHALMPGFHFACALRAALGSIGHVRGTCSCYVKDGSAEDDPPGLTKRQAARLVADYVRQQQSPQPGRN